MKKYLALLRGINVGGNNIIKMADLKRCFEEMGFENLATYIQSGNVIFENKPVSEDYLKEKIEKILGERFGYSASVFIITSDKLKLIVKNKPDGFGERPDLFRYDVMFLKSGLISRNVLKDLSLREGVDRVYGGEGVVYFSRLIEKVSQSKLAKITNLPVYKNITIRNWNTTTKLLEMMEG